MQMEHFRERMSEGGMVVLPMPGDMETGGLLGDGGRHRWTPTLHNMSSSIFLLGPLL